MVLAGNRLKLKTFAIKLNKYSALAGTVTANSGTLAINCIALIISHNSDRDPDL
jgi:hypothetical protein